jgi:hypothetical protein
MATIQYKEMAETIGDHLLLNQCDYRRKPNYIYVLDCSIRSELFMFRGTSCISMGHWAGIITGEN